MRREGGKVRREGWLQGRREGELHVHVRWKYTCNNNEYLFTIEIKNPLELCAGGNNK